MRWPALVRALIAEWAQDETLVEIFEDRIFENEDRSFAIPCLLYSMPANVEDETFERCLMQFTIWTRDSDARNAGTDQEDAEEALRNLHHRMVPYRMGDVAVISEYAGRTRLEGPGDGVLGVAVDFLFRPFRTRYTPTVGS